ncbi:enoyl-CoA hydratase/isomerase family protein [Nocardioides sp.]|uniref:enoyl-CoA hydratase/isomerase family protein n=1 Tax=Nocardioides sp. TaxID=35761 RepID=UPI0039E61677
MSSDLLVERADGVVTITFNRPHRRNALTPAMFDSFADELRRIALSESDRVLVLAGAPGAFCAGMDLNHIHEMATGYDALHRKSRSVMHESAQLFNLPVPTIAKVDGPVAGLGYAWALSCDFVIASTRASFTLSFAKRGIAVEGGLTWILPRLVGLQQAKRIGMLAERLDAEEARTLGLVTELVEPEDLDRATGEFVRKLRDISPSVLLMNKSMMNDSFAITRAEAEETELRNNALLFSRTDFGEGVKAFLERREPVFGADGDPAAGGEGD